MTVAVWMTLETGHQMTIASTLWIALVNHDSCCLSDLGLRVTFADAHKWPWMIMTAACCLTQANLNETTFDGLTLTISFVAVVATVVHSVTDESKWNADEVQALDIGRLRWTNWSRNQQKRYWNFPIRNSAPFQQQLVTFSIILEPR